MTTGEKIAALRRKAGMSQEVLADQLGISRQAVSKWEADQAVPGMDNLVELGRIFGVPVDAILRPDSRLPESESTEPENAAAPVAPPKQPVLTGKIRWFAIAAVLLVLAVALCNLVSLIWIGRLQKHVEGLQERVEGLQAQVNAIPERTDTVYIPQSGVQEESALADFDVSYDLQYDPNAQLAEMLHVSIYARPKELHPENETAKFSIQSGSSSWTCGALLGQDNAYSGDTEIPMRDAFSFYLVLTDKESGMVRNILVDHLTGVEDAYTLQFSSRWQTGGITSNWSGTHVSGYLEIQVYSLAPSMRVAPQSAALILRKGDEELERMNVMINATEEELALHMLHEIYLYAEPDWTVREPLEALTVELEIVDDYGRTTVWEID